MFQHEITILKSNIHAYYKVEPENMSQMTCMHSWKKLANVICYKYNVWVVFFCCRRCKVRFVFNSKCQKLVFADVSYYGHVWLRRELNSSIKSFKLQSLNTGVSSSYYHSMTIIHVQLCLLCQWGMPIFHLFCKLKIVGILRTLLCIPYLLPNLENISSYTRKY